MKRRPPTNESRRIREELDHTLLHVYIGLDGRIYVRGPLDVLLWRSAARVDKLLRVGNR